MGSWSRGRVTLVGDAGYCPGPAVGDSTSLAVLGAYVLAGELATAGGDHERGFAAYEREMADIVRRSRVFASARRRGWSRPRGPGCGRWCRARGWSQLCRRGVSAALARLNTKGIRMHDTMPVKDYPVVFEQVKYAGCHIGEPMWHPAL